MTTLRSREIRNIGEEWQLEPDSHKKGRERTYMHDK